MLPNHRLNLLALAKYLDELVQPAKFNMRYYWRTRNRSRFLTAIDRDDYKSECGTVACAVGHAALLFEALPSESWSSFSERVFGVNSEGKEWRWMFGPNWSTVDNTPQGAAKRIRLFVEKGLPGNSDEQYHGDVPLNY